MQDMEFTIENKKLYMLQTRNGKRTAAAALKIAVDLVDEGMITEEEAVALQATLAARYPELDVELFYGGQPIYYYIVSLE